MCPDKNDTTVWFIVVFAAWLFKVSSTFMQSNSHVTLIKLNKNAQRSVNFHKLWKHSVQFWSTYTLNYQHSNWNNKELYNSGCITVNGIETVNIRSRGEGKVVPWSPCTASSKCLRDANFTEIIRAYELDTITTPPPPKKTWTQV
jgi:hypothetical protein